MFHLIEPQLGRVSGGLRYNHAVLDAAHGQILRHELSGSWPDPSEADIAALHRLIERLDGPVLLDGLIGCSLPTPLVSSNRIVMLVHALAAAPEAQRREGLNVRTADAVVATSRFAAEQLHQRYGIQVEIATPGVEARPAATGGDGGNLICVGAIEPNKNQLFLARVLHELGQRGVTGWRCTFAGPLTDRDYAQQLQWALEQGLQGVANMAGELDAHEIDELYDSADLLLLPSHAETFGMVVAEATAAGVSALVSAGTGAEDALGGGAALELDEAVWTEALHRWLTDDTYRERLKAQARRARAELSYGWRPTAEVILRVLTAVASH